MKDILKKILAQMQAMEASFLSDKIFQDLEIQKLRALLVELKHSPKIEFQKISTIADHLHPQMELRFFINQMVPVERLLERNLRDDQFLVLSEDRKASTSAPVPMVFLLENLRSAFNVGSIFRLADCLNISEIYLIGYTLTPDSEQLKKTSLGATNNIQWQSFAKTKNAIEHTKSQGYQVIGLETAENSESLFTTKLEQPTAFLVGNERFGLEISSLELCDRVISIPTFGIKNSLNVSQALSIASYEWRRQWK